MPLIMLIGTFFYLALLIKIKISGPDKLEYYKYFTNNITLSTDVLTGKGHEVQLLFSFPLPTDPLSPE